MTVVSGDSKFGIAKWIVSPALKDGATHTTLTGAYTAASAGDTIVIRDGTYIEDLVIAKNDLTFLGTSNQKCVIVGKISSSTVDCYFQNLRFETNGDYALEVSGGLSFFLFHCKVRAKTTAALHLTNSSANIYLDLCEATVDSTGFSLFTITSGDLFFYQSHVINVGNTVTSPTFSGGIVIFQYSHCEIPLACTSTATYDLEYTEFRPSTVNLTALTTAGTGSSYARSCYFESGTQPVISIGAGTTMTLNNATVSSSNTNAITGAGTLSYTPINFIGSSSTVNTTTQTVLPSGPRILTQGGAQILSGSGDPNATITSPQGSLYLRTDGSSTSTRAYINTDSGTTWTAITTAA